MNTNRSLASSSTITRKETATDVALSPPPTTPQPTIDPKPLHDLVKVMQSVKTDTPEAKLNKHSISDGNGGRIEMNDHVINQTFKGVEPRRTQVFRGVEQPKQNRE